MGRQDNHTRSLPTPPHSFPHPTAQRYAINFIRDPRETDGGDLWQTDRRAGSPRHRRQIPCGGPRGRWNPAQGLGVGKSPYPIARFGKHSRDADALPCSAAGSRTLSGSACRSTCSCLWGRQRMGRGLGDGQLLPLFLVFEREF